MVSIGTKAMDVTNASATYRQAFGNFPDETCYHPGMHRMYEDHQLSEETKGFIELKNFCTPSFAI